MTRLLLVLIATGLLIGVLGYNHGWWLEEEKQSGISKVQERYKKIVEGMQEK